MAEILSEEELFGEEPQEKRSGAILPGHADALLSSDVGPPPQPNGQLYGPPVADYYFEQPGTDVEERGTLAPLVRQGGNIRVGLPKILHAPYEAARRAFAPQRNTAKPRRVSQ